MKILYLVVLYNCTIIESSTCKSIINSGFNSNDSYIYIWDNSPIQKSSLKEVNNYFGLNSFYYHSSNNTSLGILYNQIIRKYHTFDYIQIFDQDSEFYVPNNNIIFDALKSNTECPIFLPKIYSDSDLYSPSKLMIFKGIHYDKWLLGLNKSSFYTAITSGILLNIKFLIEHNLYFNEELKIYGVDTDFIERIKKYTKTFYLLDFNIKHDLSEKHLDNEGIKSRRKICINALKISYKNNLFKLLCVNIYYFLLKICNKI